MKKNILVYTFVASLGGLLFGFDTAVINGAMPFFVKYFTLSDTMKGFAVSSALFGCVFGALFAGKLSDAYGRRYMLRILAVLFFISAIGTGLSINYFIPINIHLLGAAINRPVNFGLGFFVLARIIGGLAIGGASVISTVYISEIAPPKKRGMLAATFQLAIVVGILIAFSSDLLLVNTGEYNWRWMFLAGCIPALIFFVLLFYVKRSPRWLVKKGYIDEAKEVLKEVVQAEDCDQTLADIRESIDAEIANKSIYLFKKPNLRLVLIGFAVGMFNQFTGINIIMYYTTDIFRAAGFTTDSAIAQTVMLGVTNLIFTLIAMSIIDKVGRKTLLLFGSLGMTLFLGLFGFGFITNLISGYGLLALLLGFVACFAASQGAVIWVLLSEMFPNNIRARGSSIGSFSHWMFNTIIAFIFPVIAGMFGSSFIEQKKGVGIMFIAFAVLTFISYFFFSKFLFETKGKSLEQLEHDNMR
ncbi:MAG: sugar porter family MFS transporter [Bacteroidota bacterium]